MRAKAIKAELHQRLGHKKSKKKLLLAIAAPVLVVAAGVAAITQRDRLAQLKKRLGR
jgi:hypothetical protein